MEPSDRSSRRRKIAFIKRGIFSHCNQRASEQVRRVFPEFDVEEIDLHDELVRRRKWAIAVNLFWVFWLCWRDILTRRQSVRECFDRTPYIFFKVRELISSIIMPHREDYVFSLQTQSLFDSSVPGLPHFIYTDHCHLANLQYPAFSRANLFSRQWIDLEQQMYRRANHVFVMSEHVRRALIDRYGCDPEKCSAVHAGSNVDPSPLPLQNDGYRNQTIVFVGIDWERKGGPTLVKAFQLVRERFPQARLMIVGCSPAVSSPGIEVVGRIPKSEVKVRLVQSSIFCFPTRIEPFGVAVVEAFFHNLPAVVSNIGAMPDLVVEGKSGLLVPPDDPPALAQALIELLSDPEKCRRFGEFGHEVVEQRYSWDEVGRQFRAVIEKVLQPPASEAESTMKRLAAA